MAEVLQIQVGADLEAASRAFIKLQKDIETAMAGGGDALRGLAQKYQRVITTIEKDTNTGAKSVAGLEAQLKRFQEAARTTTNPEAFLRYARAAEATKQRLEALDNAFNLASQSFSKISPASDKATAAIVKSAKQLDAIKKPTRDATESLSNLSRIAQDAPFGFIGITNNINPMLESFQRLKKETGGTGAALKAMVSGLTGAGGLGLAVGVASSLLVVFGDKLFGFGKKAAEVKKPIDETTKSIAQMAAGFAAESVTNVEKFRMALTDMNIPLEKRNKVLDDYNKLASDQNELSKSDLTNINAINKAIDAQIKLFEQRALVRAAEDQIKDLYKVLFEAKFGLQKAVSDSNKGSAADVVGNLSDAQRAALPSMKAYGNTAQTTFESLQKFNTATTQSGLTVGEEQDAFNKIGLRAKGFTVTMKDARKQIGDLFAYIRSIQRTGGIDVLDLDKIDPKIKKVKEKVEKELKGIQPPKLRFDKIEYPKIDFVGGNVVGRQKNPVLEELLKNLAAAEKPLKDFNESVREAFAQSQLDMFASIGEGIGAAIGGGASGIESAGQSILNVISSLIDRIGQALIKYGVVKTGLDKILKGGIKVPGVAALALGISAIAFARLVKNIKPKPFADGGLVYGPTMGLVGEGRGTNRSNPEVIAPLDKLRDIIGGVAGGGNHLTGEFRIAGKDLVYVLAQNQQSQRRKF